MLKQIEEDKDHFKAFAQDVQNNIAAYPELMDKMIKESMDFLMKNFDKWYDELKMELVNHVKNTLGCVIKGIKSHDQVVIFRCIFRPVGRCETLGVLMTFATY